MATKTQRTRLGTVTPTLSGTGARNRVYWSGTPAPASVSSTQTYSYSFASLLGGSLSSSATITSVGTALPTGWTLNSSARTLDYAGTGSATTTSGIILRATSGSDTADCTAFSLTTTGATAGTGTVQTLQLATATVPGTYPFTVGVAFKKGDVPSTLVTDLTNYQVVIKRTWVDGSAKHAIISGRVTYTSADINSGGTGYVKTITLSRGVPSSSTSLTHADILAANPSAVVTCTGFGSVSLQTLLPSGPFRTWVSGPEMVECHYRGDVGTGTELSVWFHVRLYADGRKWIRAIVENAYLDNGAGGLSARLDRTYAASVTIGGSSVYSNASLLHCANTRWMSEGWIGGDPQITPKHDVAYLKASKLVPNYYWSNPSSSALNQYRQTYTPMSTGDIPSSMPGAGANPSIAYLPDWNAMYLGTGDARAYRATLANSSHVNSFGMVFRSKATNDVVKPSLMPNWNIYGNSTILGQQPGIGKRVDSSNGYVWEKNHQPLEGYFAYLITGDYWHYETLLLNVSLNWLMASPAYGIGAGPITGLGVNRVYSGTASGGTDYSNAGAEPRGVAWFIRNASALGGIAPDADINNGGIASEYRQVLASQMTYLKSLVDLPGINLLGTIYEGGFARPPDVSAGFQSHWMQSWWVASQGWGSEIEALPDMTNYNAVRDWMYRIPVGLFGDATGFWFRYATTYWVKIADGSTEDPRTWVDSWATVYNQTFADAPGGASSLVKTSTLATTTNVHDPTPGALLYPTSTDNNPSVGGVAGYLIAALAYAVDHGASGAAAAWNRLINATNWASFYAGFANNPQWGVAPRTALAVGGIPAHIQNATAGQWTAIGANTLDSVKFDFTGLTPVNGGSYVGNLNQMMNAWSGGCYDPVAHRLYLNGGGHHDYSGNEWYAFNLFTNTWSRLDNPSPYEDNLYATQNPGWNGIFPDGGPLPIHTYEMINVDWNTGKLYRLGRSGSSLSKVQEFNTGAASQLALGSTKTYWSQKATFPWPDDHDTATVWLSDENQFLISAQDGGTFIRFYKYKPSTDTATTLSPSGSGGNTGGSTSLAYSPSRQIAVVSHTAIGPNSWTVYNNATNTVSVQTISGATLPTGAAVRYDAVRDRFIAYDDRGADTRILYSIDPTTWTATAISPTTGATPTTGQSNGIKGRFQYCKEYDVFIAFNQSTGGVYLYKPTGWAPPGA